jgi:hypothetical protein
MDSFPTPETPEAIVILDQEETLLHDEEHVAYFMP